MAAITRAVYDPSGFPTPIYAAAKLLVFLAFLVALVLGLPALAGLAIYEIAS